MICIDFIIHAETFTKINYDERVFFSLYKRFSNFFVCIINAANNRFVNYIFFFFTFFQVPIPVNKSCRVRGLAEILNYAYYDI